MENLYLRRFGPLSTIIGVAFIAHGLLLISDGIFVDGWHIHQNMILGKTDVIRGFFYQQGLPLASYFHQFLYLLPNPILGYRVVSFLSLAFSAIFIYKICLLLPWFTKEDSLLVSIVSLTFPAFQQTVEHTAQGYLACLCLWLGMAWGALNIEANRQVIARHSLYFLWRLIILIGFAVSFHTPSLLVIHVGFIMVKIFYTYYFASQALTFHRKVQQAITSNLDYLFFPFLYWVISKTFLPSYGFYASYNRPEFKYVLTPQLWIEFIRNAIFAQLDWGIRDLPGWFVIVAIMIFSFFFSLNTYKNYKNLVNFRCIFYIGIGGVVFLLLGMLPYIAVNKIPQPHGESTRFALLVGIPVAIMLSALVKAVFLIKSGVIKQLVLQLVFAFVLCLAWGNISNYLAYQAQASIIQSLQLHLSENSEWKKFSNFKINNYFEPRPNERHSFYLRNHMPWEWSGIFESIYGDDVSRVMIGKEYDPYQDYQNIMQNPDGVYVAKYFLIDKLQKKECISELTFSRTPFSANMSSNTIASRYWLARFSSTQQLTFFLRNLTKVELRPPIEPACNSLT